MSLRVIGAGFGRTGTLSMKAALEQLGFGACYHMIEVFGHQEHVAMWRAAAAGDPVDWEALFDGYQAAVDWPACAFWPELVAAYPDAKVVLTTRDPQRWYESFRETIYEVLSRPTPEDVPGADSMQAMGHEVVIGRSLRGSLGDRDHLIDCFEAHNEAVRGGVPADRLLEFRVADGWEPLCEFLGCPVPDEPFPNVNDREFFQAVFGLSEPA